MSAKLPVILCASLILLSCGYVGDPLPPALHIPEPVSDLRGIQRGDQVEITFHVPALTTDGIGLRVQSTELRAAPTDPGGDFEAWSASAEVFEISGTTPSQIVERKLPISPWIGRQVWFAARVRSHKNKWSEWSNVVSLNVIAEVEPPMDLSAEDVSGGVRLRWRFAKERPGRVVRVWKKAPGDQDFQEAATVDSAEWVDTETQLGQPHAYALQAVVGTAESVRGPEKTIVPVDKFPPDAPSRLAAVAGSGSVELAWDPSTDADFASYRVYRATGNGAMELIADNVGTPSFRDTNVAIGGSYRYHVTAMDTRGNESTPSNAVRIEAQ